MNLDLEEYKKITLSVKEEKQISKIMKLEQIQINRLFHILKFILSKNKTDLKIEFKKDLFNMLRNLDGATFNLQKFFKNRKSYGPLVIFHDEPDYKFEIQELAQIFSSEQTSKKILLNLLFLDDDNLNHFFNIMEKQFNEIYQKCLKILKEII